VKGKVHHLKVGGSCLVYRGSFFQVAWKLLNSSLHILGNGCLLCAEQCFLHPAVSPEEVICESGENAAILFSNSWFPSGVKGSASNLLPRFSAVKIG
jgi:hypothetical protein